MSEKLFINKDLLIDSNGKIKILDKNTLEGKQDQVSLYLDIAKDEISFSDFGNILLEKLFQVNDEKTAKQIVDQLISDIQKKVNLNIKNSVVGNNGRKLFVHLVLEDDQIIEVIN